MEPGCTCRGFGRDIQPAAPNSSRCRAIIGVANGCLGVIGLLCKLWACNSVWCSISVLCTEESVIMNSQFFKAKAPINQTVKEMVYGAT